MINTNLICQIFFRFCGSTTVKSIISEIKTTELYDKDNEWVLIKTIRIFQSRLISDEFSMYKGDICYIRPLEPCEPLMIEFPLITNKKEEQNIIRCEGLL